MKNRDSGINRLTKVKYFLKFTFFLINKKVTKLKQLQKQYIDFRDEMINSEKEGLKGEDESKREESKIKKVKSKSNKLIFPLLVLFDAENMPIQKHYRLVQEIIIARFGKKSWNNAVLETAYQESTEFFNNKGYNQDIKTHYVPRGKNKADDKLVEIAEKYKIPTIIIVSNDKGLIERLQNITSRNPSGKLFVFNGRFIKDYTLTSKEIELVRLRDLKIRRDVVLKELEIIERDIVEIEKKHGRNISIVPLIKLKEQNREAIKQSLEVKEVEVVVSENLKSANLDDNIRKEFMKNPLLIGFTEELKQVSAPTIDEALEQSKRVLDIFTKLPRTKNLLESEGLNITIFKIALRYAIDGFNQSNYGYSSFVDYIKHAIKGSSIKLVLKGAVEYRLLLKDTPIDELNTIEVVEEKRYDVDDNLLTENFGNSLEDLASFKS